MCLASEHLDLSELIKTNFRSQQTKVYLDSFIWGGCWTVPNESNVIAKLMKLFAPDTDRLMSHLEKLMSRVPAFSDAGIKTINNGPMCWTPDGLLMLGPIDDKHPGLWLASGFNVGIGTGGGSAEFLAHWMVHGKPLFYLPIVHADRFGNGVTTEHVVESIKACYRQGYRLPESI